ncbi:SAM-dependent methyltransferase [Neobacillus niacini]|uniref:class I SAM-dependent methyltransferase n=1 Tax=Neobacillus niacini TaxID=86668 RepID=UPI00286197F5|nr:SAM-dependent methyltransferase [Neobacillus niacini]MDR6998735.1 SAM-dependent MidA family methyltransferase [Neobacillus niacini]
MITYLKKIISESPNHYISYADFISAALYHPDFGYYMKEKVKIGRKGDFITTSNISDVYGRLVAKWFSKIYKQYELPLVFCEIGAGNGRFAHAFLMEWYESVKIPIEYLMVESSPFHRKLQKELIGSVYPVTQLETLEEINGFEGMIFSNEFFDALPVHVIEKENGNIFEVMVGIENNELFEKKVPLSNQIIVQFLSEHKLELKEKQRFEVPLVMEKMIEDISKIITKGLVVSADYGYINEEWMQPARLSGSLRGYYQHQMLDNILQHPGEIDITTHIQFDQLIQKGEQVGLEFVTKLRQDEFLLKAGILEELENHFDPNPFSEQSKRNRAIRSLIMPSGISSYFHIIIQQKGLKEDMAKIF